MTPYYADDSVTLYHGDCREVHEWLAADVLITDPPYGIDYRSGWHSYTLDRSIVGDRDRSLRDQALVAWGDGPGIVFGSPRQPPFGTPNPMPLIFDKGDVVGMGDLSWPWRPSYELAWVYGTGWHGTRGPAVLRHRVLPGNFTARDHPTQKPTGLLEDLIGKAPAGIIADPFAGSGSTLVAAKRLGRRAVGVEIDERYCEVVARRLDQGVLIFDQEPA